MADGAKRPIPYGAPKGLMIPEDVEAQTPLGGLAASIGASQDVVSAVDYPLSSLVGALESETQTDVGSDRTVALEEGANSYEKAQAVIAAQEAAQSQQAGQALLTMPDTITAGNTSTTRQRGIHADPELIANREELEAQKMVAAGAAAKMKQLKVDSLVKINSAKARRKYEMVREHEKALDEIMVRQDAHGKERTELYRGLIDQEVNANRLWQSAGTGGQIALFFASLVAQLPALTKRGMRGQNAALKAWDQAVARDISAQKFNIQKQERDFQRAGQIGQDISADIINERNYQLVKESRMLTDVKMKVAALAETMADPKVRKKVISEFERFYKTKISKIQKELAPEASMGLISQQLGEVDRDIEENIRSKDRVTVTSNVQRMPNPAKEAMARVGKKTLAEVVKNVPESRMKKYSTDFARNYQLVTTFGDLAKTFAEGSGTDVWKWFKSKFGWTKEAVASAQSQEALVKRAKGSQGGGVLTDRDVDRLAGLALTYLQGKEAFADAVNAYYRSEMTGMVSNYKAHSALYNESPVKKYLAEAYLKPADMLQKAAASAIRTKTAN